MGPTLCAVLLQIEYKGIKWLSYMFIICCLDVWNFVAQNSLTDQVVFIEMDVSGQF